MLRYITINKKRTNEIHLGFNNNEYALQCNKNKEEKTHLQDEKI